MKRVLLGVLAALLLVPAFGSAPAGADHPDPLAPKSGINVHMSYFSTVYGGSSVPQRAASAQGLDQPWVRDQLTTQTQSQGWYDSLFNKWRELSAHGANIVLILGKPGDDVGWYIDKIRPLVQEGVIDAIEGPNEWDLTYTGGGYPGWENDLRTYVQYLWYWVGYDRAFSNTMLVAPALGQVNQTKANAVGDLSPWVDIANLHFYVAPSTAGTTMSSAIAAAQSMAVGRPMWVTETGCATGAGSPKCTEAEQKTLYENSMIAFGQRSNGNIHRVFYYELVDCCGTNHGAYRADWTAKPVAASIKAAGSRG